MSSAEAAIDRGAVCQLLAEVKYLKDQENETAFAGVWAQDASLVIRSGDRKIGPIVGRGAIMDFYRAAWARGAHGTHAERETHIAENPYVSADDDGRISAVHNLVFLAMQAGTPTLVGFGRFEDVIVEEEGRLRILHRISTLHRRA